MSAEPSREPAPAGGREIRRAALTVLATVLAARVLLLPVLAWNARYVMDEYSQAAFPRYAADFYRGFDPIKTVLYVYVFQVAHRVADRAVDVLHVARLEGALLAFLVAGLTWGMSRRLGRDRFASLFSVAVLFSFTNFVERSFRVRSDTVAVFFAAAAAFAALGGAGGGAAFLAGVLSGAAFLSTQKAVYPLVAIGAALVASGFGALPLRRQVLRATAFGGGVAAALLAYAAWFDARHPLRVLEMVFLSPLRFAPLHANPFYEGIRATYVTQTLVRNPFSYAVCAAGLAIALSRWKASSVEGRLAAAATLLVTAFVFRHEQPWPYVFVMALPFLALFAPEALAWAERRAGRRGDAVRLGACLLLLAQLPRNVSSLAVDNAAQNDVVSYAEAQLGPEDRYFDGIVMVPTRDSADPVSWESMILATVKAELEAGEDRSIRRIFAGRPKLWILSYRTHELRAYLVRFLDRSYVRVHPDVLLAGAALPTSAPVEFRNPWPGRYRLVTSDGAPARESWTLDGREVTGETFVPPGAHAASAPGADGPRWLLPADATLPGPLPVRAPPHDLFAGVYD